MKNRQLILGLLICLIGVSVVFVGAYISMNDKKENATIKHELAMVLIDENGNETDTESFPSTTEYYLDFSKSFCENGSQLSWDKANNKAEVIANKADKCKLYFRKNTQYSLKSAVLATNEVNKEIVDFSVAVADGEASLNRAIDDNGYSYYFRGDVENNYVEFGTYAKDQVIGYNSATSTMFYYFYDSIEDCEAAGKANCEAICKGGSSIYWRIVRINGDGSIRLIYDGPEKIANGMNHIATIGNTKFGAESASYIYNGYTYTETLDNQTDSVIKVAVENWYETHLEANYEKYLADSIFCNDRTDNDLNYPISRINNYAPQLICINDADKYTVNEATGNGYLDHPVALLTVDEAMMAGLHAVPANVYLYSGERYWTMTPNGFTSTSLYIINESGTLFATQTTNTMLSKARPVINIKADTMFTGLGTIDSPYKLVETANE